MLNDLRYAIRSLARAPGFALAVILTLGLGIGANTAIFSVVRGVLLRPLPHRDGDRLVYLRQSINGPGGENILFSVPEILDFRDGARTLSGIAEYSQMAYTLQGEGDAVRINVGLVTGNYFQIMGLSAILGRTLHDRDDGTGVPPVMVLTHEYWTRRFGGDSTVIGKALRANGVPYTIVGVMPEGFRFPDDAALWLPLQLDPVATRRGQGQWLDVAGRLKAGVTMEQATADVAAIAERLATEYKATNENIRAQVMNFIEADMGPEPRQLLTTMLGAVFFVLLIACANVANLLMDRAAHKSRDVGIRTALGATRGAVIRQFLTEAFVLSAAGAVFGTILAWGGIALFNRAIVDTQPPFYIDIALHPPVLAFVAGVSLLATLLSGIIPAYQSSRSDLNEVLKDESRGSSSLKIGRMSKALVVFEVALSCALLVASGLMIRSVTRLGAVDPGFRTSGIFTARIGFPATYTDTAMQRQFHEQLRERLMQIPGVQNATLASGLPAVGIGGSSFTIEGRTYERDTDVPTADLASVAPNFFSTFDIAVTKGRPIDDTDRADGLPVAVINQAFAEQYFPGQDPLGRRFRQPLDELRDLEALPLLAESLATRQRLHGGRDHLEVATSHNNLAACLDRLGRFTEALEHFEIALAMLRRLGADRDHADIATCLNNVASCLQRLGRPSAALPRFEMALAMRHRLFGDKDHRDVVASLYGVASCLEAFGRATEALPRYEAGLAMALLKCALRALSLRQLADMQPR